MLRNNTKRFALLSCCVALSLAATSAAAEGKVRLFILSGQSNMAGLPPQVSFTPTVEKAFSADEVIVVKDAVGGQPIRQWYKQWKPAEGPAPETTGVLYDRLITKVRAAIEGKKVDTMSFVWMQGERDAKELHSTVYEKSLAGLVEQLRTDLGRDDITVVIGRLSDHLKNNQHWDGVRAAQVAVAEKDPLGDWVDTDDLNGPRDGLHYDKPGYVELGKRFAEKTIALLNKN
ncbi:MAG: acetyl xylan esterase [Planctomycetes bacterium]|nr:acetyl xylan esterase [Planctomycetota bacterium]